jgi:hypothetical protein
MNAQAQQRTVLVTMVVIAGMALAACNGTSAGSTAASAQASVGAGGSVAATTGPSASAVSGSSVAVDLVFSGTLAFTAKGTAGQCSLGHSTADGSVLFGFIAREADYPGLGDGLSVNENEDIGGHRLILNWLSAVAPARADLAEGQGVTYSSDHKSITIDADIGSTDKPEHLSGTISCP